MTKACRKHSLITTASVYHASVCEQAKLSDHDISFPELKLSSLDDSDCSCIFPATAALELESSCLPPSQKRRRTSPTSYEESTSKLIDNEENGFPDFDFSFLLQPNHDTTETSTKDTLSSSRRPSMLQAYGKRRLSKLHRSMPIPAKLCLLDRLA